MLYVTLPLKDVPGGFYNITISNSDGVNGTAEEIFYVTDQAWYSKVPKTVLRTTAGLNSRISSPENPESHWWL